MNQLTHYFELKAIPQAEMIQSMVISHLMQLLHGFFPEYKGRIGTDFPSYSQQRTLGGIIRLLGSEQDIKNIHHRIQANSAVIDYGILTNINNIPRNVDNYARFSRVRKKGNSDLKRLEKRLREQGKWDDSISNNAQCKWNKPLIMPHVHLQSSTTGQVFILSIKKEVFQKPIVGIFNAYGLSQTATVPQF